MKRLFALLILILILLVLPQGLAFADSTKEELEEYVQNNVDGLETSGLQEFCDSLGLEQGSVKDRLAALIRGELTSPRAIVSGVWDIVTSGVRECLPSLIAIVVIAILYNMLFGLTEGFVGKSTVEVVHLVCYAAILATVVSLVVGVVSDVRETADRQVNLLGVGTPPLMALTTVLGGSVSSGVLKPQLAIFSTLLARIIAAVVIPLFIVSVVLSVVGNLSDNVRLGKLVSAVRYLIGCVLGVSFGLYTTYLTVAGVAGSMADTVSIRAARYVIGNYVPLVGGYISQGFDLVATSLSLIKNALGAYAMILTVAVVLRPLVKVLLLTVGLKLVAGLIQPVGDQRMASMVGSVADCMRSLTAATAGVGFAFLVTMLLVMSSTTMVL